VAPVGTRDPDSTAAFLPMSGDEAVIYARVAHRNSLDEMRTSECRVEPCLTNSFPPLSSARLSGVDDI
jgi:hypothetical protein